MHAVAAGDRSFTDVCNSARRDGGHHLAQRPPAEHLLHRRRFQVRLPTLALTSVIISWSNEETIGKIKYFEVFGCFSKVVGFSMVFVSEGGGPTPEFFGIRPTKTRSTSTGWRHWFGICRGNGIATRNSSLATILVLCQYWVNRARWMVRLKALTHK